ncbi:MAG: hypothetical protein KDI92_12055 [Xanthomonadales bacterium]|nr:hypothetical protein [Xanthomonadales bacterium]
MKTLEITKKELIKRLNIAFEERDYTLISCCDTYNKTFLPKIKPSISGNARRKLQKDFLRSTLCGEFSYFNERIKLLCEFLKVSTEPDLKPDSQSIAKEICEFNKLVRQDPSFEKRFSSLAFFLENLTKIGTKVQSGRST